MTSDITIWGYSFPTGWLMEHEVDYLSKLPGSRPSVEWVWAELDRVWVELDLDNSKPLDRQQMSVALRLDADQIEHVVGQLGGDPLE